MKLSAMEGICLFFYHLVCMFGCLFFLFCLLDIYHLLVLFRGYIENKTTKKKTPKSQEGTSIIRTCEASWSSLRVQLLQLFVLKSKYKYTAALPNRSESLSSTKNKIPWHWFPTSFKPRTNRCGPDQTKLNK